MACIFSFWRSFVISIQCRNPAVIGLLDGVIKPCQSGKWRKLGSAVGQWHGWMFLRHVVWKVDDVSIILVHNHFVYCSLCFVTTNLRVAFDGSCSLVKICSSQDGILAVALLDVEQGLLHTAFLGQCLFFRLLTL